MNQYELERLERAIEERDTYSCYLNSKVMVGGGSNIDSIDVDFDIFLALGNSEMTTNDRNN